MLSLTIDDKRVEASEGTTILEAAKSAGIEIPHFCYHPLLSIDGNCRMCAVEVDGVDAPVISCKEAVREGMIVRTQSRMAVEARTSALEFILANHPLDCPICDRAGECTLQDYYFKYSRKPSRMVEEKIKKSKVVDAGPHIVLDAERCIGCTRCIRFCEEIVGRHEIGLIGRGATQEIASSGKLANDYSLCTVDLCPVGALTSKDFRFAKRAWFLESSPSVCTGCATGCNTWIDHAAGVPHRVRPRNNDDVNGPWMCDYGRMTYKRLTSSDRLLRPTDCRWDEAVRRIAGWVEGTDPDRIAGVLSAHATLEENAALYTLLREAIGTPHVFMSRTDDDPSFADRLLRNEDVNPNVRGALMFTKERLPGKANFDMCFVLGPLTDDEIKNLSESGTKRIVLMATHRPKPGWTEIALPIAAIEEQEGTLINKDGLAQRIVEAYPPPGEAKPGWMIAEDIAQAMDKPMNIMSAGDALKLAKKYG
jgi:NADH-quinone oxidoreductase subunit G